MRKSIIVVCLFSFSLLFSQSKEHIVSHDGEVIVTDPSKGNKSHKQITKFPQEGKPIRRIMLLLTLECPDNMRCADWDYSDHIMATPKRDTISYEIARFITPYGGRFQKDWKFQWEVDVTDFSEILRNDVEIDYIHSGYEDNKDRGWKLTLDFEVLYGPPVAKPLAVHTIYNGSYRYGDEQDPIENHLIAKTIEAASENAFSKLRVHQTGHGMDADGCGEFCNKYREVVFNGEIIDHKALWMECGDNPLYPQAGTWIFDRANWCPGQLIQPDEVMLSTTGGKAFTLDINMEPYVAEKPSANEDIWAYVVEYGAIGSANDVTLLDIISPSEKDIHRRKNRSGGYPVIRIKNNGKNDLKKLRIVYHLADEKPKNFDWSGTIPFGETALLSLPEEIYAAKDSIPFTVSLKRPNGKKDGFPADNEMVSIYRKPDILPQDIVVHFNTNKARQNAFKISKADGSVVFERDSLLLNPSTTYRDSLQLSPGSYSFEVFDAGGDGLEFWFKAKDGQGSVRILDTLDRAIKHFGSDFGSGILYNFVVRPQADYQLDDKPFISVFPARTDGPIALEYFSNEPKDVKVIFVDENDESKVMEEHTYHHFSSGNLTYNLSYLPKMRYYIKVVVDGKEIFKNRIRLKE